MKQRAGMEKESLAGLISRTPAGATPAPATRKPEVFKVDISEFLTIVICLAVVSGVILRIIWS